MRYWELRLVRKTPEQYAKVVSSSSSDYYIVTFILPSNIPQFNGLSQRIQKVKASMPTGDIIALLCKRYKVSNPEQFAITSVDDFVFSRSEGLEYYGLGKKFDKMTVRMATLAQLSKQHRASMRLANPEFAWTQVDEQLDIREARAVILDMDKQLGFAAEKTTQLRSELDQTKTELKKVIRSRDVVSEERDHIVAQAKKLIEIYVATKGKQEGLQMEKTRNLTEIENLKGQIDRLKQQFSQERSALEQKAKALALELLAERGRSSAFQKDYENSQERVASLEATLSRVKDAMVRASTEIKTLRATEISLGEEIETLNAEIAQRRVSENQLTQEVSDLKAEKQQLQTALEATYAERDELNTTLSETRDEMEALRKASEKDKLALRSEIETLELKVADEASQARLEISEVRHELEDALAKVEEGNRKLLLAEQQRKQVEAQFEAERQGFQDSVERLRSAFANKRAELEQRMEQQMNQAASADTALAEINGEVSSLRKERDGLTNQLAQQEQNADKVKAELEAKIRRLEDEMAAQAAFPGATGSGESSEALKRIREQALQLQREVDMLRLQSKQAQDRTALVEKDLEMTSVRVKELSETNEKYRHELSKTKQEMDRTTSTVATLQTQLDQTRQTLEKEQKTSIEVQQKASQLDKKVGSLEVTVKSLQEDLDESSKQKEELSTQLASALEFKPRLAAVQKEKEVLEEQWDEQKKSYEERIDKLVKEVEFLSMPPTPPPAMPSPAGSTRASAAPGGGNAGNLETQIQSMKDALNKIGVSDRKNREVSQMNSMASLIITGLEKRFKLANQDESEAELLDTGGGDSSEAGDDDWLE
jgi:chromosome segregation ATPase